MVKEGFFTQDDFEKILFSNNLQEIETFIEHYQPPALRTYKKSAVKFDRTFL